MNKIQEAKTKVKEQYWIDVIRTCCSSGMKIKQWCKENGICEQTYYRNLRKYRTKLIDEMSVVPQVPAMSNVVFEEVPTTPYTEVGSPTKEVKICIGNATLIIPDGTSPATIEAVIFSLSKQC